jgi:MYXO-CTERM domain-containing protein
MHALSKAIVVAVVVLVPALGARGALVLTNGNFDADPDLGGADETNLAPTGWFTHYTNDGSWSDFRYGNDGNGAWTNNGITLGQNYTPDPGPEDGYFYTSLGRYGGEVSATVAGFGYNRVNNNPAGAFEVAFYFTPGSSFTGADASDVAAAGTLLARQMVDISSIRGTTPQSLLFRLQALFAGSGIQPGDQVWLRIGDGPDDGNLDAFDEPTIDNLTLTTVVPEPTAALALFGIAGAALRRRRV